MLYNFHISQTIICSKYLLGFGEVRYYLVYKISQIIICSLYLLGFGEVRYHLGHIALQYSFISQIIMICSRYLPGFGKLVIA